ncbi:MAG: TonB-dependent receptor [Cyclobacteriaceae bacterium]|nr:TonB-dependent receptor [Cyclobacteriaceae bacterium]UYN85782.1 MAG: TonB-dependent receptor [Cyclobacteriaceae bacterium]
MNRALRLFIRMPIAVTLAILISVTALYGQTRSVSGVVKTDGEVLPGVTVTEKGTSNGTVTDSDGKFVLSVSSDAILVFTFIGMKPTEVPVGTQTVINVNMVSDISQLEEVVVIGYGTAKKSDLTGSVVSVIGDDLKKMPVATVTETLTGRLAGVQVTSTEGSPDADIRIRIRGGGSLTQDATPLFIVDGFPVNSINDISPSDIKSIDVLKDASSTAIFGSRGANGVVIITTKGGTDGKVAVSYNSFFGVKRIANTLDVLNPEDFVNWQYEYALLRNDIQSYERFFGSWQDRDLYTGLQGNDWQRQIYGRTGRVFSNDLSVRGGSDKFNYSFNYARFDDRAIMIGSNFTRNNVTLSLKNKASNKVNLGFTVRYSDTEIFGGGVNEQREASASADARLRHSVGYSPIPLPGLTTDDTDEQVAGYLVNPFVATADNDREQQRRNFNMVGSFDWKIIDNLQFRTELGMDNLTYFDNRFYGRSTYYSNNNVQAAYQGFPAVVNRNQRDLRLRNANTFNYDFKHLVSNSNHKLNLLVGQELIFFETSEIATAIQGFPKFFDAKTAFKLNSQGVPQSVASNYLPDDKLLSFFGRLNYDLMGKYLLSATYRADGSSKFLGDNRWGYFPSVAAAWKVSEESFMTNAAGWLNSLKLRASYGEAGNNNIPVGQTIQTFESGAGAPLAWINGVNSFWAPSKIMANPNLKWETTITRNVGLDFGILKGRVNGTVEAYLNTTNDLLIRFPVPGSGYDFQYRNMGSTENKGLETSVNYIAIDKANYGLNFSFNISFNRNKIKSLGMMNDFPENTGWASTAITQDFFVYVGGPIGKMYGYRSGGRYEVDDFNYDPVSGNYTLKEGVVNSSNVVGTLRPGMMKLKDLSGPNGEPDGIVNQNDLTIIGDANPKHTGGFIINAYAYGFDLMAAFNWSYGNDIYNANKIEFTSATVTPNGQYRNLLTTMGSGSRWTNLDPATGALVTDPAALAALNANTTMWSPYMQRYVFSDWAVEDGSFLRLNTLTLGYTVPSSVITKLKLTNLRFYATGYNVFLLTKYSGLDPEVSTRRRTPLTPGVDYSPYPRSRQLVFGLSLNF